MSLAWFLCFVAAATGVASHLLFFIRGEHHVHAPLMFRFYLLVAFSIFSCLCLLSGAMVAIKLTSISIAIYAVCLLSSMTVYRTFFHPLHQYPGPFMAKISKLWHVSKCVQAKNYVLMQQLHEKYGDVVRTGPNELTVFKAQAVPVLDGVGTECNKSPWYDLLIPRVSLATTRDKVMHDRRRRVWDRGFSASALRDYENLLIQYAHSLDQKIASAKGSPVDVSRWFYLYSFDVMGRLAFGKSYNMLTDDENHFAVNQLHSGMKFLGPFSPVPWLVRIGYSLPGIAVSWKKLLKWSQQQANERLQAGISAGSTRDIMSWLVDNSQKGNDLANDTNWVSGDAFAAVIAGSDTVASTLTYIFYHLCLDPDQISKLRLELEMLESIFDMAALRNLAHLNAIINETLRLHPALPTGGLRDTPSDGVTIDGIYIPGNVTVCAPRYVLGRLEESYEQPLDFIPERWYSRPELVRDKSGFSPFSIGRHSCIGKHLSLMQLRSVIAILVMRYDICFGPDEDGVAVCRDMKDQFNQHPGKLDICFIPRVFM